MYDRAANCSSKQCFLCTNEWLVVAHSSVFMYDRVGNCGS